MVFEHRNYLPLFGIVLAVIVYCEQAISRQQQAVRNSLRGVAALGMIENVSFSSVSIHAIRDTVVLNAEELTLATTIPTSE